MAAEAFLGICERGDLQGFRGIVKRVNVDGKNENGYSGLALAVRNGHSEIAYELIREDADVNSVNEVKNN